MNVAETISQLTREHLEKNNGMALGQCLTAVGWVGGTVPEMKEKDGLVELSMADVAGGAIAVGAALAGRRPIYIVRYQGFQWYNATTILNYAAKSKEIWGIPCPVFVRSISMEGGVGPVASNSHHGIYNRMPGVNIVAPMTPGEYKSIWRYYLEHDDPMCVSEHRRSFLIDYEMEDIIQNDADITLFPISATRLNAIEATKILETEGIKCNIVHLLWIKPFTVTKSMIEALVKSKHGGIVIDGDYENGVAKSLAYDIMQETNQNILALGIENRTAGFAPWNDNLAPSADRICELVRKAVNA